MTCKDCRFYIFREIDGDCRRYPPTPVLVPMQSNVMTKGTVNMSVQCYFPALKAEFWCGEFQERTQ